MIMDTGVVRPVHAIEVPILTLSSGTCGPPLSLYNAESAEVARFLVGSLSWSYSSRSSSFPVC